MAQGSFHSLPNSNVQVLAPLAELDFFDSQSVTLARAMTPLAAWTTIMARPMPLLKLAFGIRDAISSRFGVKRIGGFSGDVRHAVQVGEKLDFFVVEYVSPEVLTLTERDRHLDVMTCISVKDAVLTITSSVKTHIGFGRAYMVPVGPAHKLIVRSMLRWLQRRVG